MIKKIFLVLLALFFIYAGVNHFLKTEFYLTMMPPYLPYHRELVYLSGAVEILCGILLFIPRTRTYGAWLTILTLIAVFPANIYMAQNPELFPKLTKMGLYIRLPFQLLFIGWAALYIKEEKKTP